MIIPHPIFYFRILNKRGVEVFKFNGVTDEHAVLRIRIFKNSGDGKARTQDEINVAGKYYKSILIGNPPSQTATDKKYFLHNE